MSRSRDAKDWFNGRLSGNGSSPWFTQVYEAATDTWWDYAVHVTLGWQAVVIKREVGSQFVEDWEYTSLTAEGFPGIGNVYANDSHNCIAICVDGLGYIHITGNTHDAADTPINRFQYIRSTNPHDITSWEEMDRHDLVGWDANSEVPATSCTTYSHFRRFSDGGVLWAMSMSEGHGYGAIGRDIGLWYCAPNANEFLPAQGGTTTDIMRCVNNATDGADRSYTLSIHIDRDDVTHFVGVFREVEATGGPSQLHPFYMRSYDRGVTWKNIAGTTITMPMTRAKVVSDSAEILIDGTTSQQITGASNMVIHDGDPYFCCYGSGTGSLVIYHDGSVWRKWTHPDAPGYQIDDVPSLAHVGNALWLFGYDGRSLTSWMGGGSAYRQRGAYMGRPWSPASDSSDDWVLNLGQMIYGQHDIASPSSGFDDGCILMPAEPHQGGTDPATGQPVARFFMPDGDIPEFVQIGGHGKAASA